MHLLDPDINYRLIKSNRDRNAGGSRRWVATFGAHLCRRSWPPSGCGDRYCSRSGGRTRKPLVERQKAIAPGRSREMERIGEVHASFSQGQRFARKESVLDHNAGQARYGPQRCYEIERLSSKARRNAAAISGTTCASTAAPFSGLAPAADDNTPSGGIGTLSTG